MRVEGWYKGENERGHGVLEMLDCPRRNNKTFPASKLDMELEVCKLFIQAS